MKTKIFYVLFALVLVLSLSLMAAPPVLAAATITINGNSSASQNGLTFAASTSSLTLTGAITMNAATTSPGSLFTVDAGTLNIGGNFGSGGLFFISRGATGISEAVGL
jgi:hypothetical protein